MEKEKGVSSSSPSSEILLPSLTTPLSGDGTHPKASKLSVSGGDSSPPPPIVTSELSALNPSQTSEDGTSMTPLVVSTTELNVSTLSAAIPGCQGVWVQPIKISSNPSVNTTNPVVVGDRVKQSSSVVWPSLLESQKGQASRKQGFREPPKKSFKTVVGAMHKQEERKEDDLRFPWAARMNPVSRNLYRATEPEYLEDGTPKVTIPSHVLRQGLENQKEYILGQFYRCSPPPGGLIFAVFNKLWGRKCRITIRKLGESNYLFHIPDETTRNWVLQRALWHVDDCLMFVAAWSPEATLAIPEIKTIPVWVTLKKIPNILYSIPGISHIASGLGAPMATHKPRLDPILMGEAKILVEVELSKAFPPKIAAGDENGFISMVDVEYAWLPTKCSRCGQLGHKVKRCLQPVVTNDLVDGNVIAIHSLVDATQSAPVPVTSTEVSPSPNPVLLEAIILEKVQDTPTMENVNITLAPSAMLPTNTTLVAIESLFPETIPFLSTPVPVTSTEVSPSPNPVLLEAIILEKVQDTPTTENVNITLAPSAMLPTNTTLVAIESLFPETIPFLSTPTHVADANHEKVSPHSAQREHSLHKSSPIKDCGSNRFASLVSSDDEDETRIPEENDDHMDLLTPMGKRILRERPVKPSTKAKEMKLHFESAPRGNRGRGRGGRG
ncbi:hypothetical protein AALP_AA3G178200 [Arabis alpina]|uniref:CCHC-type domain-containing protein n=1 Tax=Arabis alpina TaxID=50452 RepID=A0A087H9X3_ARAAL|nr:hypothetical protein AALP_AA3G178200 [Arabis alpina]